jgi:hypothetical protein
MTRTINRTGFQGTINGVSPGTVLAGMKSFVPAFLFYAGDGWCAITKRT